MFDLRVTLYFLPFIFSLACTISSTEFQSLFSLYSSAGGPSWSWNASLPLSSHWIFPSSLQSPCNNLWQGVTCHAWNLNSCSISMLQLSSFNLHGFLSNEFASGLQNITHLDLSFNRLTSSIPSSIGNISSIKSLLLNSNQFTGSISSHFSTLTNLVTMDIDTNSLTGGGKLAISLEMWLSFLFIAVLFFIYCLFLFTFRFFVLSP